jgi:hypothetical protein
MRQVRAEDLEGFQEYLDRLEAYVQREQPHAPLDGEDSPSNGPDAPPPPSRHGPSSGHDSSADDRDDFSPPAGGAHLASQDSPLRDGGVSQGPLPDSFSAYRSREQSSMSGSPDPISFGMLASSPALNSTQNSVSPRLHGSRGSTSWTFASARQDDSDSLYFTALPAQSTPQTGPPPVQLDHFFTEDGLGFSPIVPPHSPSSPLDTGESPSYHPETLTVADLDASPQTPASHLRLSDLRQSPPVEESRYSQSRRVARLAQQQHPSTVARSKYISIHSRCYQCME